jgi:hypothetical protein
VWKCKKCHESVEGSFEVCWNCGTSRDGIEDPNFLPEVEGQAAARTTYPVSKLCPHCGGAEYTTGPPAGFIAFVKDRICKSCHTRYTPPTPFWAAVVFILIGLPLAALMLASIIISVIRIVLLAINNPLRLNGGLAGASILGFACEGFFAFIGVLAIAHGIRALRRTKGTS